jgi:hypothetical protein
VLICRDASAARRQASRNWTFCALRTMHLHVRLVETESAIWTAPTSGGRLHAMQPSFVC